MGVGGCRQCFTRRSVQVIHDVLSDSLIGLFIRLLFSPNWEIRHGAAMALREVIKTRGAAGGMKGGYRVNTLRNNYLF